MDSGDHAEQEENRQEVPMIRRIFSDKELTIEAVDGSRLLLEAGDVFDKADGQLSYVLGCDPAPATKETKVEMYELIKTSDFMGAFEAVSQEIWELCFTQHQIISFIEKHRDLLAQDGAYTMFLFQGLNEEVCVAFVCFCKGNSWIKDGTFYLGLEPIMNDSILWQGDFGHRLVVPQPAIEK